jgi:hypothetical protein
MRAPPRAACLPFLLALLLWPALGPSAWASAARDELLRLVPDDVGLCLAVTDLRGHADKLLNSPWVKRLFQSPLGQELTASPEVRKLDKLEGVLRQKLDVDLARLRDDIFGDAVVFAYRFGPPGKREQEQGLMLLRARDAKLLARLVDRINKEARQSGEVKELEPRDYRGVRYYYRKKGAEQQYYFVSGPLLALAGREELLKEVMDRRLAPAEGRKPSGPARGLRGTADALAALWLNPRALDAELREKATRSGGIEARVLQTFRGYWEALDGITVALVVGPEPELRLALQGRPEALPPACRRLLEVAAGPSELWERFPRGAAVTLAGRLDFAALDRVLADFLTPEADEARRQGLQRGLGAALGMDVFADVLPRLGPDWGLCVVDAPGRAAFPHVLFALRVRPGPEKAPVDRAVVKALQFFAELAVYGYNSTHKDVLRLKAHRQGPVQVKYLTGAGALPPGVEPAFALKEGYLVLASSPAAVERFGAAAAAPPPAAEVPLLRLSLRELARLLQPRKKALAAFLAGKNHVPAKAVERGLDGLLQVLALADRLDLTQRSEPGQVTWTLRLRFDSQAP